MKVISGPRVRHCFDFGLVAIELRIEHGMRAQPIGAALQKLRSVTAADRGHGALRSRLHGDHVHAIDRERRHAIRRGLRAHVGHGFRARQRRSHGIQVVLADEEHGKSPERGKIERLVKLALGDRTFAEEARRYAGTLGELLGQRETGRDRQAAADDRVASIEAPGHVEYVHRSATAAARARALAEHLRHQRVHRHAARERVAVLAIGRDDRVLRFEGSACTPTAIASSPL